MKYAWIKEHRDLFPVACMCAVLEVSTSGYYASLGRTPSDRTLRHDRIKQKVAEVHAKSNNIYGSRKIAIGIQTHGEQESVCRNTVATAMQGIRLEKQGNQGLQADNDSVRPHEETGRESTRSQLHGRGTQP